jgi:hypothetical protein
MFIATCLIVLLLSLCTVFIALMIWLAHSLEGYPALLISHAQPEAVQLPMPLFLPNGSAILDTLGNSRSTRGGREHWPASAAIPRAYQTTKRNKTAAI